MNGHDANKKGDKKLSGIALKMNELFEAKMAELQEIRELINTGRCHKRELLENLVEEQLFKVHLRSS